MDQRELTHSRQNPFRWEWTVSDDDIDENGHVNNVVYVQWMQDVATRHSDTVGATEAMRQEGGSWVARSHTITYLKPAFAGDRIEAKTWIADIRRVRSKRRYQFAKANDGATFAEGETEWVFVDSNSGRPRSIPDAVKQAFQNGS